MTKLTIVSSITTKCSDADASNSDGADGMLVLSLVQHAVTPGGRAVKTSTQS